MTVETTDITAGTRFKLGEEFLAIAPPTWRDLTFEAHESPNANGWFGAYSLDGQSFHFHKEHVGFIVRR